MKKFAGKIAMVLILVMLASSFTGCLSYWGRSHTTPKRVAYAVVDIVTLPISLICLVVYVLITGETETQGYMANLDSNSLTEFRSLYEKMSALPEAELASLTRTLHSIPEAERKFTMDKINSLSETKLVALAMAYNSLPQSDMVSSVERILSLPEEELVSLLRTFNSLTEAEFNSLIESMNSQSEIGNVALIDNFNLLPNEVLEVKPVTVANAF